jgi:8-oxo-dGTP pyrophosphatase MutT (NUDIX family)
MMVERQLLFTLLSHHQGEDDEEAAHLERMRNLARELEKPFDRTQPLAHFTGSAVVVDPPGERVCMLYHSKLQRWLQPGGHSEPEDKGSLEVTALREAREETGCSIQLHAFAPRPLDVDIHLIPARPGEPAHEHLDVRYLVIAENPEALAADPSESSAVQWLSWDEALRHAAEAASRRLLMKARRWAQIPSPSGKGLG